MSFVCLLQFFTRIIIIFTQMASNIKLRDYILLMPFFSISETIGWFPVTKVSKLTIFFS